MLKTKENARRFVSISGRLIRQKHAKKMGRKKFYLKAVIGTLAGVVILFLGYRLLISRQSGINEGAEERSFGGMTFEDNFVRSALNYIKENVSDIGKKEDQKIKNEISYFLHKDITSTVFWIGEKASDANNDISNSPSAWDEKWKNHFGGTDTPKERNGFLPAKFTPQENPFYVALPFNDFDSKGKRKKKAYEIIPWAKEKQWKDEESLCKNRWVKIIKNDRIVYAQWEDVGPYEEDDTNYVFGNSKPKNKENESAGIDVSPAVRDYLNLEDIDKVDWQFVDEESVPSGPWKKIVTESNIYWKN